MLKCSIYDVSSVARSNVKSRFVIDIVFLLPPPTTTTVRDLPYQVRESVLEIDATWFRCATASSSSSSARPGIVARRHSLAKPTSTATARNVLIAVPTLLPVERLERHASAADIGRE